MIDVLIQGAATPLAIGAFFLACFIGARFLEWFSRPRAEGARPDNRIPRKERELLGDDWRDCLRRVS